MILKGSQRGGPRALAAHLLNAADNDHVTLAQSRGFASDDLFGAMAEVQAVSKGTRCRQPVFSLSLNPPKGKALTTEELIAAADRADSVLGLSDQPRAVVIHEKDGRKHAHAVWSRIEGEKMTAINMAFYKLKLNKLSKELFLENGWELPDGHKTRGWKNPLNFTLAEWQQAKRMGIDPREIKQIFQSAWAQSDNRVSFRNALEESGFYLARGDRRGVVAIDLDGNVFAVSRWTGVKTKDVTAKLGDGKDLPGVDAVKGQNKKRISKALRAEIGKGKAAHKSELKPLQDVALKMRAHHRAERELLATKQGERWAKESKARASKFKRGLGIVMDVLTGRLFALRKENEKEAFAAHKRDTAQREQLGKRNPTTPLIRKHPRRANKTFAMRSNATPTTPNSNGNGAAAEHSGVRSEPDAFSNHKRTTDMKRALCALGATLLTLSVTNAQQQIQWKQVTNLPKGLTFRKG